MNKGERAYLALWNNGFWKLRFLRRGGSTQGALAVTEVVSEVWVWFSEMPANNLWKLLRCALGQIQQGFEGCRGAPLGSAAGFARESGSLRHLTYGSWFVTSFLCAGMKGASPGAGRVRLTCECEEGSVRWNDLVSDLRDVWAEGMKKEGQDVDELKKKLEVARMFMKWRGAPPEHLVKGGFHHVLCEIFQSMVLGAECQNMALELIALLVGYYPGSITVLMEQNLANKLRVFLEFRKTMSTKMHQLLPCNVAVIARELSNTEDGLMMVIGKPDGKMSLFEHCFAMLNEIWEGESMPEIESLICDVLKNVAQWTQLDSSYFVTVLSAYERGLRERPDVSPSICHCLECLFMTRRDQRAAFVDNEAITTLLTTVINEGRQQGALSPALFLIREFGKEKQEALNGVQPQSLCFIADRFANESNDDRTDRALLLLADVLPLHATTFEFAPLLEFLSAQVFNTNARYERKCSLAYIIFRIVDGTGLVYIPDPELLKACFEWSRSDELIAVALDACLAILSRCEPDETLRQCISEFLADIQDLSRPHAREKIDFLLQKFFSEGN